MKNLIIFINEDKIKEEYASVANFCKEEHVGLGVYNGLKKKTSRSFQAGSASFKLYKKLKEKGYIFSDPDEVSKKVA